MAAIMDTMMSNITMATQPDTYMGIFNEVSKYSTLNVFERLWFVRAPKSTATPTTF